MKRKLTSTNRFQVLLGRALYIFHSACFYGYALNDVKSVNLNKRARNRPFAWRTQDGWHMPGRGCVWRLNIPASVVSVVAEQNQDGFLTWQGELIVAERISLSQLQLEDLFL
jgi:hypothetical protein